MRHTPPMFSKKAFLDVIDKLSWWIDKKNKKQKKNNELKPTKISMAIFGKSIPAGSAKWNFFMDWKNIVIVKFLIMFYPMWDFNQDLASSINC